MSSIFNKEIKTLIQAEEEIKPLFYSNNERWQLIGSVVTQVNVKSLYKEQGLATLKDWYSAFSRKHKKVSQRKLKRYGECFQFLEKYNCTEPFQDVTVNYIEKLRPLIKACSQQNNQELVRQLIKDGARCKTDEFKLTASDIDLLSHHLKSRQNENMCFNLGEYRKILAEIDKVKNKKLLLQHAANDENFFQDEVVENKPTKSPNSDFYISTSLKIAPLLLIIVFFIDSFGFAYDVKQHDPVVVLKSINSN